MNSMGFISFRNPSKTKKYPTWHQSWKNWMSFWPYRASWEKYVIAPFSIGTRYGFIRIFCRYKVYLEQIMSQGYVSFDWTSNSLIVIVILGAFVRKRVNQKMNNIQSFAWSGYMICKFLHTPLYSNMIPLTLPIYPKLSKFNQYWNISVDTTWPTKNALRYWVNNNNEFEYLYFYYIMLVFVTLC